MKRIILLVLLFCCNTAIHAQVVQLPQTGQTQSFYAGDDGAYQSGKAWPTARFEDHDDGTVTDHLTGLMWLKDANCMLTHYPSFDNADSSIDGGVTWHKAHDFVSGINDGNFGDCRSNHTDWHVPNINEIISLIDYGKSSPALPESHPFVNIIQGNPFTAYVNATTKASFSNGTLLVDLDGGYTSSTVKDRTSLSVWPVRVTESGSRVLSTGQTQSYYPGDDGDIGSGVNVMAQDRFVDQGNGTVKDTLTDLLWVQSLMVTHVNWVDALDYVAGMNAGTQENFGYTDWRIPNMIELRSIISHGNFNPALPPHHAFTDFPTTFLDHAVLSSTTFAGDVSRMDSLSLASGQLAESGKEYSYRVAVVRDDLQVPEKLPVLIIPGIFGSWSTEMFCNDADAVNDTENWLEIIALSGEIKSWDIPSEWTIDPITYKYSDLTLRLAQEGLRPKAFAYDWRRSIPIVVSGDPTSSSMPYLTKAIDELKAQYGVSQIDIVAHSMGGLIVREYVQNHYRGDIRKFAMIGTPQQGSLDVYSAWERGEFTRINRSLDPEVTERVLENMKQGCDQGMLKDSVFIRSNIPSVKQLLPTFDYFSYPTVGSKNEYDLKDVTDMCHYNSYLINLNENANFLVNQGIKIKILASKDQKTLHEFRSKKEFEVEHCDRINWPDHKPSRKFSIKPNDGDAGDNRVLFHESAYPIEDIPAFMDIPLEVVEGGHGGLPSEKRVLDKVVEFLNE